jgi:hydrogenase nickel incorporation protein HypA/HybF
MHEMGIASSILDAVAAEAKNRPGARLISVGLRIGEVSGVSPEALDFCFQCLVKDTELEPLCLVIERSPRRHRCPKCAREFDVIDYDPTCPGCGEFATVLISGDEMEIAYLEVADG